MKDGTPTPAPWNFACDSYGKVQHSKKACVYAKVMTPNGEELRTLAARIPNWKDAMLIAAAPDLLAAAQKILVDLHARIDRAGAEGTPCPVFDGIADLHDAIRKSKGEMRDGQVHN